MEKSLIDRKTSLRMEVWDEMETRGISRSDPHGRIPDFEGSDIAADLLKETDEWKDSNVIFVSPDTAQRKVRENVLVDKKTLIMPTPKILNGYLIVNPSTCEGKEREASTIKGAFKFGYGLKLFPEVDLVVEGSVAVDLNGNRLGKGGGYGDMEISHLIESHSIGVETSVLSTVHETQIIDRVPVEPHDQKINMIVTPERVLRIKTNKSLKFIE